MTKTNPQRKGTMKLGPDRIVFNIIAYLFLAIIALCALLPFYMMIINSFATEKSIVTAGYSLWPIEFTMAAYKMIFLSPMRMVKSYGLTISLTVIGTVTSLFFSSMAAYVMYRKDVKYRNILSFYLFFTTLFNGGLMSYYMIIMKYLKLGDSFWVLLLIPMFSVFNILILKNFFTGSVPYSLFEAAKIDGAGDFTIFLKIILPISKAALASIGLFTALGYWNDWWSAMMFVKSDSLQPLQYTLYQMLSSATYAAKLVDAPVVVNTPKESLKLAMTVVATGPIIFLYPFVQKYFVSGLTIGAVKG